ncbi:cadherin domain-containing protein [Halopenitus sp. H-Gu1]
MEADDGQETATQTITVEVTNVNDKQPTFSSETNLSFAEDGTGTVIDVNATDGDGGSVDAGVSYSLVGGADQSAFSVDSSTGNLTFDSPPDYESPNDSDANNDYVVDVEADDGLKTSTQNITVNVTDIDNQPSFSSGTTPSFAEDGTGTVIDVNATDGDGGSVDAGVSYSLVGGADQSAFSVDSSTGNLTFDSPPDYENPTDSDTNNNYVVNVQANDSAKTTNQTITVTVTDIDDTGGSGSGGGSGGSSVDETTETTVTVEENSGDESDGTEGNEPARDMTVTVTNPQPGQTLVIDENGATIQEEGERVPEDGNTQDGGEDGGQDDGGDSQEGEADNGDGTSGSSTSNVRANQLTVNINTDQDFELSVTTYEDDLTRSTAIEVGTQSARVAPLARGASMMRINTAPTQTEGGLTPDEVEAAARSFEGQTGTVPAGYVQVDTTLTPEEVTDATVEFSIRRAYLDELGVEPKEVTLYHQVADDEWVTRETEYVATGDTYHRFEGSMPEFSVFALGTGASQLDVTDASLAEPTITADETATVTATVTNRGQTVGETTVNLTLGGSVVDSQTVTVEGEETADVTLSFTPDSPGEYDMAVGEINLAGLTVEAATESEEEVTAAEESGESGLPIGPITFLVVLIAVVLAGGLWWRQRQ